MLPAFPVFRAERKCKKAPVHKAKLWSSATRLALHDAKGQDDEAKDVG